MNRFFSLWTMGLVLATFLGWTGIVRADDTPAPADKPLNGTVVSIASDNTSVVVNTGTKKAPKTVTVTVDAKTTYTLDTKDAKITDLKAGQAVVVTPATGTAKTIAATSATSGGKKGGKGGNGGGGN